MMRLRLEDGTSVTHGYTGAKRTCARWVTWKELYPLVYLKRNESFVLQLNIGGTTKGQMISFESQVRYKAKRRAKQRMLDASLIKIYKGI